MRRTGRILASYFRGPRAATAPTRRGKTRRFAPFSNALALVIGLSPVAARAGDDLFICRDERGVREDVKVNMAQRKVSMITGRSPGRCMLVFEDGAYGPTYLAPEGENCILSLPRSLLSLCYTLLKYLTQCLCVRTVEDFLTWQLS